MKSLIYQCWTGPMRSGTAASRDNMAEYAKRIGADYRFDKDPDVAVRICDVPIYYEPAIPWINLAEFAEYDKVMIVDMDVFAVEGLTENIFEVPIGDVGICTEPLQPKMRAAMSGYFFVKACVKPSLARSGRSAPIRLPPASTTSSAPQSLTPRPTSSIARSSPLGRTHFSSGTKYHRFSALAATDDAAARSMNVAIFTGGGSSPIAMSFIR